MFDGSQVSAMGRTTGDILSRSPESRLTIVCAQVAACRGERNGEIRELLRSNVDWNSTIAIATRNGVLPLLAVTLTSHFREQIPPDIDLTLREFLRRHTANNLYLTSRMIEMVRVLKKAGIHILPFKGPSLAIRAYGNPVLRHYVDLDVLVKPRDFERAARIISEMGYSADRQIGYVGRSLQRFTQRKDVVLKSSDGRVHIELHWKLSGAHFDLATRASDLWDRLEWRDIAGSQMLSMPFRDLLFYLCMHGSRHEWERLGWLTDILELIESEERSGKPINWTAVMSQAAKLGCGRIVRFSLFLLKRFFDKDTIQETTNFGAEQNLFEVLALQIESEILTKTNLRRSKTEKKTYLLSLQEKRSQRILLQIVYCVSYFRILFIPNELDKGVVRLPSALHSVYFLLRPFRLIADHFGVNGTKQKARMD